MSHCVLTVPLSSPGNLRVSEEWYSHFRVTWDPPASPTVGFRIVYQPTNGINTHTCQSCRTSWTHPSAFLTQLHLDSRFIYVHECSLREQCTMLWVLFCSYSKPAGATGEPTNGKPETSHRNYFLSGCFDFADNEPLVFIFNETQPSQPWQREHH